MHQVGGELRHVAPARPGRLQRLLDLREHAGALRVEVGTGGEHAGDIEGLGCLDAGDVRVLAERLAQRIDVVDLQVHLTSI